MAWRRPGDKPLSEPMVISLLTHICVTLPQWVKIGTQINNYNGFIWDVIKHQWATYINCLTKPLSRLGNGEQLRPIVLLGFNYSSLCVSEAYCYGFQELGIDKVFTAGDVLLPTFWCFLRVNLPEQIKFGYGWPNVIYDFRNVIWNAYISSTAQIPSRITTKHAAPPARCCAKRSVEQPETP